MINNGSIERQAQKASAFYSCRLTVHSAQLGWKTTAINNLQAHYGHLPWFMGSFMEMHNTDRSSSGYKSRTQLSRAPTTKDRWVEKTKSSPNPRKVSFQWMYITHSCSLASVHTNTHTDASLHWAVLVFCCFCPWALFSLCSLCCQQRERKQQLIFIMFMLSRTSLYPLCLRERFCLPDNTCAKKPNVNSKTHTYFGFYKFSDLGWGSYPQNLEQVALPQHVAQGHVKQDTAVCGNRLLWGTSLFLTARNASSRLSPWMDDSLGSF